MERKDNMEWLVFPRTRELAGHTAGLAGYAAIAIAAMSVLDPLLYFSGLGGFADMLRTTADLLFCLWYAILAPIIIWCHYVLLAERGFILTRTLCILALIPSAYLLGGTLYTSATHELYIPYQLDLPLYLSLLWSACCLLNLGHMAAAPLKLRILIPTGFGLMLLCGLMLGIYELILPYTVLKVAACLTLLRPLLLLQRTAPRITALPPRGE